LPPCAGRAPRSTIVLLIASIAVVLGDAAWGQGSSVDFSAFADLPYSNAEELVL
jgi:hypothetical protein